MASRLTLGAVLYLFLLAAAVGLGWYGLGQVNKEVDKIVDQDWKKAYLATQISEAANEVSRLIFSLIQDPSNLPRYKQEALAHRQRVQELIPQVEALFHTPRGHELMADLKKKRQAFADIYPQVLELIEGGKRAEAAELFQKEGMPTLHAYLQAVSSFQKLQGEMFDEGAQAARAVSSTLHSVFIAFLVVSLGMALGISYWTVRSVTRPLGGEPDDAREAVQRIAAGDLSQTLQVAPGDGHSLLAALADMQGGLRKMMQELQHDADRLSQSAQGLAAASEQVARGSGAQSEAASSMAAAVEELSVSVNQVSDSAGEAHRETNRTGDLARQGESVIGQTVAEMRGIADTVRAAATVIHDMGARSQRISGVAQVIKDVADQTNLLALNAAIEAARAGEAGRGFAVVADEVGKLAERTAKATTEISEMIGAVQSSVGQAVQEMDQSVARVASGVEMAEEAGNSMRGISTGAARVVGAVNDISTALTEQGTASLDVANNVERIAQMAEENSHAARDAAATARQMEELAVAVRSAIGRFRT